MHIRPSRSPRLFHSGKNLGSFVFPDHLVNHRVENSFLFLVVRAQDRLQPPLFLFGAEILPVQLEGDRIKKLADL
jgi:hypothetical protein